MFIYCWHGAFENVVLSQCCAFAWFANWITTLQRRSRITNYDHETPFVAWTVTCRNTTFTCVVGFCTFSRMSLLTKEEQFSVSRVNDFKDPRAILFPQLLLNDSEEGSSTNQPTWTFILTWLMKARRDSLTWVLPGLSTTSHESVSLRDLSTYRSFDIPLTLRFKQKTAHKRCHSLLAITG